MKSIAHFISLFFNFNACVENKLENILNLRPLKKLVVIFALY